MSLEVRFITNITKEYSDMYKIIVYKEPKPFFKTDFTGVGKKISRENYVPSISSVRRTKTTIQDIVLCNDFELFCTFTFDPAKVDRYNFNQCSSAMRRWFSHQREKSLKYGRELKYLVIPEQHKDGAWHFHALLSGYSSTLKDTGLKSQSLRPIYNITSFRLGFTTAVKIDEKSGVSTYITKYVTKSFVKTFNGKRFFCSHGLKRPVKTMNNPLIRIVRRDSPIFAQLAAETKEQYYYHISKRCLISSADLKKDKPPFEGGMGGDHY